MMPKYRAQDYLAEVYIPVIACCIILLCLHSLWVCLSLPTAFLPQALQHRHSLLERMQVAPPHHIEFVDTYLHKGEVEDTLYTAPWLMGGDGGSLSGLTD